MNKSYKYTILTLFLAIVFIFGSMAGMNYIIRVRERHLLSESGRVVLETPVRAWQGQDGGMKEENGGNNGENTQDTYVLSIEQIEEVISSWDERKAVIHSPVNGQISMEEAMEAGEEWLMKMGMVENVDAESCSMYARLSVTAQNESEKTQLEPYYSFWFVRYSSQSMMAFLYINAVTGKVWNADVTLYEDLPEKMPYEKLECFAECSGLPASDANIAVNQEGTQAIMPIDNSNLYAEMGFRHSQTGYAQIEHDYTDYGDGVLDYNEKTLRTENVTITFQLTVSKEY